VESAPHATAPAQPPSPQPAPAAPTPVVPSSPLRAALLSAKDVDGFRALAADSFRLVESKGKRAPRITRFSRARLAPGAFAHEIQGHLPHEPDPAGGEGEDFQCDDVSRSCVFKDENGHATTYLFDQAAPAPTTPPRLPKLREIRVDAAKPD
jgi:hypothetical protein